MRRTLPQAHTRWAGVRLMRWKGEIQRDSIVIVCGLAGALAPGLPSGTVLIPAQVGLTDGRIMDCDAALVQSFVTAARTLHFRLDTRPLLSAQSMIVGDERQDWFQRGFAAADMETGLLIGQNLRVATVRVVLDSPEHGVSLDWLRPVKALLQPLLWREALWLGCVAPCYALRAAQVLKTGLDGNSGSLNLE